MSSVAAKRSLRSSTSPCLASKESKNGRVYYLKFGGENESLVVERERNGFFFLKSERQGQRSEAAVCQEPMQPSPSADDTTLLTSFTPPSHSYKLFLTLLKIPYVN